MSDDPRSPQRPEDPLPKMIAEIDQALAMVGQQARAAKGIYDAHRGEGFSEKQALYLTACFFKAPETPSE